MAKNIVQYYQSKSLGTDAVNMSLNDAVSELLTYSVPEITSFNDLDQNDKAKLAVAFFEELDRTEAGEALDIDNKNSNVICKLVALLNNDNSETRHDLCDAIKKSFIDYFEDSIRQPVDAALDEQYHTKSQEAGLRRVVDPINGEIIYRI